MPKITRGLCKHPNCTNLRESNRVYCLTHKGGRTLRKDITGNRTLREVKQKLKKEHPSWIMSYARQWARSNYKHLASGSCRNCGYSKHVELCHIRPIKDFPG